MSGITGYNPIIGDLGMRLNEAKKYEDLPESDPNRGQKVVDYLAGKTGVPSTLKDGSDVAKKKVTGAATSSAQSVSQAPTTSQGSGQGSVGVVDTTTRRGSGQGDAVVGLLGTIQKTLLGI